MEDIERFFKIHELRATRIRKKIYTILSRSKYALSHTEIKQQIGESCDRVTIYRTLETFIEKGLVHKILDENGIAQFALCAPSVQQGNYHPEKHLHFRCLVCGHIFCLENREEPALDLPDGFSLKMYSIAAEGYCKACAKVE